MWFVERLHGKWNMERWSSSVQSSGFIYWCCGYTVYPVFSSLFLFFSCLFFSRLFFSYLFLEHLSCFDAQTQISPENNSRASCRWSRAARGLLHSLIDEQRFLWRTPHFPPRGSRLQCWVVPRKAPTHGLGHKISRRMLIAEDKHIHTHTLTCVMDLCTYIQWLVLACGVCWFMATGASGHLFCLCNVAVMLEEWPAGLNLYVVLRRCGQLCRQRLAWGMTTCHLGFPPTETHMWWKVPAFRVICSSSELISLSLGRCLCFT